MKPWSCCWGVSHLLVSWNICCQNLTLTLHVLFSFSTPIPILGNMNIHEPNMDGNSIPHCLHFFFSCRIWSLPLTYYFYKSGCHRARPIRCLAPRPGSYWRLGALQGHWSIWVTWLCSAIFRPTGNPPRLGDLRLDEVSYFSSPSEVSKSKVKDSIWCLWTPWPQCTLAEFLGKIHW